MLHKIRTIFCPRCFSWGTGPECEAHDNRTPAEKWAMKNSNLCSPEELVAAHIIQSIAKDFDDWKLIEKDTQGWPTTSDFHSKWNTVDSYHYGISRMLQNRHKRKNVKAVTIFFRRLNNDHCDFNINNTPFDDQTGQRIVAAFDEIKQKRDKAERIARRVLEEQKALDARWNLAESLLGMKRNEHGALVPEKAVCGADYPCDCSTCC